MSQDGDEEAKSVEDKGKAKDAETEAKTDEPIPKATAVKVGDVGKSDGTPEKPEDAKVPPTRKQEAVPRPTGTVVAAPKPFTSTAEYVKGYERQPGKLEILGDELCFFTPKKDLAGKVALIGILALALEQFDRLVTVPIAEILDVTPGIKAGMLEVRTAKETLAFAVPDRDKWIRVFAGDDPAADVDPNAPMTYPDDGPLAANIRHFDNMIGLVEKGLLVALLAVVCLTAAAYTLLDHAFHYQIAFKAEVVHNGTFAIAMLGGVFATQQARHLSMDLISRRFSPRNRLFLKVTLAMFVAFIVVLMIRAGFHVISIVETEQQHDLISGVAVAWLIPIAGALIILHTLLHTIIDIDYLMRRKTPPDRMRSGH